MNILTVSEMGLWFFWWSSEFHSMRMVYSTWDNVNHFYSVGIYDILSFNDVHYTLKRRQVASYLLS